MDYCNGTTHFWSDDSYDSGSYPCPGPPSCTSSRKEADVISKTEAEEERMSDLRERFYDKPQDSVPSEPTEKVITLRVSIPVTISAGSLPPSTEQYNVGFDGSQVTLTNHRGTAFSFPWAGIEAAIKMLGSLNG